MLNNMTFLKTPTVPCGTLSKDHPHFRLFLAMFLGAWIICGLAHLTSFWVKHTEGDEVVYLSLAREMNWSLSHYTTMDDPVIRQFPFSNYRHPLFLHPPLLPLILKIGSLFDAAIVTGLLFANLSIGLMLLYTWRAMVMLQVPPRWAVTAFLGIAFCPLLLFSTSRLHLDGLLGIWLLSAFIAYIEALDAGSVVRALLAGGMMVVAMNLRYSGIAVVPLVLLGQGYHLYRLAGREDANAQTGWPALWSVVVQGRHWIVFAVVLALVLSLGFQHYYRVLAEFHTLRPGAIVVADPNAADFSPFLQLVLERSPWHTLLYLVLIFPVLVIFLTPWPYRTAAVGIQQRDWSPAFPLVFLYLLLLTLAFTHTQIRYFAAATPALFLSLPVMLERSGPRMKAALVGLCVVTLWMMVTTGFLASNVDHGSATVVPSGYYYFPFLEPLFDFGRDR